MFHLWKGAPSRVTVPSPCRRVSQSTVTREHCSTQGLAGRAVDRGWTRDRDYVPKGTVLGISSGFF